MTQQTKVGRTNTAVFTEEGITRVVYHNTPVVSFNNHTIILNNGGWKTATTKTRMNQASRQFDLGYHVYQLSGEWFIEYNGHSLPFTEPKVILNRSI